MTERLVPKTHIINAIRARNYTLEEVLFELADNGVEHGKATEILIAISNTKGIAVYDNGIGVDDVNRIFQLGNSSSYHLWQGLSQYGVGAKDATIFLGDIVRVKTIRNGRVHEKQVDWHQIERTGKWPEKYTAKGMPVRGGEVGTTLTVTRLWKNHQLATSEKVAKAFGQTFAPALRKGLLKIIIMHELANGKNQTFEVEAYTPPDLTDGMEIGGIINGADGAPLRWSGRAGLSATLPERFNAVHVAFGHRVIEATRDPFQGKSVPTLYAEVELDRECPWKYCLSDHKTKVVKYRDELIESIYKQIEPLLLKSEHQAHNLALREMTAPIESALNKAMKGAGILRLDEEDEAEDAFVNGEEEGFPNPDPDPKPELPIIYPPNPEGPIEAKEITKPTGVRIDFCPRAKLEGKAFNWQFSGKQMTVVLAEELFKPVLGWPPAIREKHVIHLVVAFVSHAIEVEFRNAPANLAGVISRKFFEFVNTQAGDTRDDLAPYVYGHLVDGALAASTRMKERRPHA